MSRYKPKTYAKALTEIITNYKGIEQKKLLDEFVRLLQKNGDFKKAKEFIALAERLLVKTGKRKIIIETARQTNVKTLAESLQKEGDLVEGRVNPDLIAGVKVLVNGDLQLDFSFKKLLNDAFEPR